MTLKVRIECDTYDELLAHLSALRMEVKKEFAQQKRRVDILADGSGVHSFEVFDNNCYGVHHAKLTR